SRQGSDAAANGQQKWENVSYFRTHASARRSTESGGDYSTRASRRPDAKQAASSGSESHVDGAGYCRASTRGIATTATRTTATAAAAGGQGPQASKHHRSANGRQVFWTTWLHVIKWRWFRS